MNMEDTKTIFSHLKKNKNIRMPKVYQTFETYLIPDGAIVPN